MISKFFLDLYCCIQIHVDQNVVIIATTKGTIECYSLDSSKGLSFLYQEMSLKGVIKSEVNSTVEYMLLDSINRVNYCCPL